MALTANQSDLLGDILKEKEITIIEKQEEAIKRIKQRFDSLLKSNDAHNQALEKLKETAIEEQKIIFKKALDELRRLKNTYNISSINNLNTNTM